MQLAWFGAVNANINVQSSDVDIQDADVDVGVDVGSVIETDAVGDDVVRMDVLWYC